MTSWPVTSSQECPPDYWWTQKQGLCDYEDSRVVWLDTVHSKSRGQSHLGEEIQKKEEEEEETYIMEKAFNSSLQKREKRGGSLSLVEDTLHTFGWGLKGPGGSIRICSSSSPHLGLHAYILSGEGLRNGEWGHENKTSLPKLFPAPTCIKMSLRQKKENRQYPKNRVGCASAGLFCIALCRVEKRVGVVGGHAAYDDCHD